MNWEAWLVPIIALAVLILGSIFRAGEQQRSGSAKPGSDDDKGGRPRRTPTEIDEFLREARRRRTAEAESKRQAEPFPPPVTPPKPVPRPQIRPRPRPSRPAAPPPRRVELLQEEVIPVVLPATLEPVTPGRTADHLPSRPERPRVAEPVPPPAPRWEQDKKPAPALQTLASLLGSRENLRLVIVLREILDPPLCRRGRSKGT